MLTVSPVCSRDYFVAEHHSYVVSALTVCYNVSQYVVGQTHETAHSSRSIVVKVEQASTSILGNAMYIWLVKLKPYLNR